MKNIPKIITSLLLLCLWANASFAQVKNCDNDQTGLVPLSDLGNGFYLGFQGGLYPGGSNTRPANHQTEGEIAASLVVPLDENGVRDDINGKIVFTSIGMSNTRQEFGQFIQDSQSISNLNPQLEIFNGAEGGKSVEKMIDVNAAYWTDLKARLQQSNLDPLQVQVVWFKQVYSQPPTLVFPDHAISLAKDLGRTVLNMKVHFPNVKICYLASRIYGGYSPNNFRNEPLSYETGFAHKWLVEAQINDNLLINHDPRQGPAVAPWLSWGPYLWADGVLPRSDGLFYTCDDMADDGHHPGPGARTKISQLLLDFYTTDATATPWFLD